MRSILITTAGNHYELPNSLGEAVVRVLAAREGGEFVEVPSNKPDAPAFFVNPEHVVTIYAKEA